MSVRTVKTVAFVGIHQKERICPGRTDFFPYAHGTTSVQNENQFKFSVKVDVSIADVIHKDTDVAQCRMTDDFVFMFHGLIIQKNARLS